MGADLAKSIKGSSSFLEAQSAYEAKSSALLKGKFVIVYLHGLTMDAHEADALAAACQESFGDQVINIQPKSREGLKSIYLSIEEQAKYVVEEVKMTLHNNYPLCSKDELQSLPIHLFGYSQGGIVACIIAANHKDELNITSLIAAHSPLSGTDVLENTRDDVNEFHVKAKSGLKAVGHSKTLLMEAKAVGILLNNFWYKPFISFIARGVRDMRINSACIANVKNFIRKNSHNIPILIIASFISDMSEYFYFAEEDKLQVDEFIRAYTLLTTKKEDGQHDLLISLKRQLCRTESYEILPTSNDDLHTTQMNEEQNLLAPVKRQLCRTHNFENCATAEGDRDVNQTVEEYDILIPAKRQLCRTNNFETHATSTDQFVYPKNVKTYIAEETIHCYNLMPIFSNFVVNHGKTLFQCQETIAVIIEFINSNLSQNSNHIKEQQI